MASSILHSSRSFALRRDHAVAATSYDPCAGIEFTPTVGSDELFEALKLAYPRGKTHRSRMREAVIEFLISEQEAERSRSKSPETVAKEQGPVQDSLLKEVVGTFGKTAANPLASKHPLEQTGLVSPPSDIEQNVQFFVPGNAPVYTGAGSKSTFSELTIVWNSVDGMPQKPRMKKAMNDQELEEYRLRRTLGACRVCKAKKRKCTHDKPQTSKTDYEIVPQLLPDNSRMSDSPPSIGESQAHDEISRYLTEPHAFDPAPSIMQNIVQTRPEFNDDSVYQVNGNQPFTQIAKQIDPGLGPDELAQLIEVPGINEPHQPKSLLPPTCNLEGPQVDTWDTFYGDYSQFAFSSESWDFAYSSAWNDDISLPRLNSLSPITPMAPPSLPVENHSSRALPISEVPQENIGLVPTESHDFQYFDSVTVQPQVAMGRTTRHRSSPMLSQNASKLLPSSGRNGGSTTFPTNILQKIKDVGHHLKKKQKSAKLKVADKIPSESDPAHAATTPVPSKNILDDVYLSDPLSDGSSIYGPEADLSPGDASSSPARRSTAFEISYRGEPCLTPSASTQARLRPQKSSAMYNAGTATMHYYSPLLSEEEPYAESDIGAAAESQFPAYELEISEALRSHRLN